MENEKNRDPGKRGENGKRPSRDSGGRDLRTGRGCRSGLTENDREREGVESVEGKRGGSWARGGDERRGWRCCVPAAAAAAGRWHDEI